MAKFELEQREREAEVEATVTTDEEQSPNGDEEQVTFFLTESQQEEGRGDQGESADEVYMRLSMEIVDSAVEEAVSASEAELGELEDRHYGRLYGRLTEEEERAMDLEAAALAQHIIDDAITYVSTL